MVCVCALFGSHNCGAMPAETYKAKTYVRWKFHRQPYHRQPFPLCRGSEIINNTVNTHKLQCQRVICGFRKYYYHNLMTKSCTQTHKQPLWIYHMNRNFWYHKNRLKIQISNKIEIFLALFKKCWHSSHFRFEVDLFFIAEDFFIDWIQTIVHDIEFF